MNKQKYRTLTLELSSYYPKFPLILHSTHSNSDWLFITQSMVLVGMVWFTWENNEKAALHKAARESYNNDFARVLIVRTTRTMYA